jgi:hypothetical protein
MNLEIGRNGRLDFRLTYRDQIGLADAAIFLHLQRLEHKLRESATVLGGVAGSFRVPLCRGQSHQGLRFVHIIIT